MMRMHAGVRQFLRDPQEHHTCLHMINEHQEKAGIPPTPELLGRSVWRAMEKNKALRTEGTASRVGPDPGVRPLEAVEDHEAEEGEEGMKGEERKGRKLKEGEEGEEEEEAEKEQKGKAKGGEGAEEQPDEDAEGPAEADPRKEKKRDRKDRKRRKARKRRKPRAEEQKVEKVERQKHKEAKRRKVDKADKGQEEQEQKKRMSRIDSRGLSALVIAPRLKEHPSNPDIWMRDPRLHPGSTAEQQGWVQCGCNGFCGRTSCPGRQHGYRKRDQANIRVARIGCPNPALSHTQIKPRCAICICRERTCERHCNSTGFCMQHRGKAQQVLKRPAGVSRQVLKRPASRSNQPQES